MASKPKILIVDDRTENLIALEKVLAGSGADFVRANSGNEALKNLLDREFALVLMDVQMPDMDGFETVEIIRRDDQFRHLPVIFVSAVYKDDFHKIRGIQKGAVDFIAKPIVPEILRGKVRIFLELHENRISLQSEIEKRKKSEKALENTRFRLEQAKERLEEEVGKRTAELTESNRALIWEVEKRTKAQETLKEAQLKIVETEKMAALGTLTAGIAHELNNPLMGALNFFQYCLKKIPETDKLHQVLKDGEVCVEHCISIVRNCLTFARNPSRGPEKYKEENLEILLDRVVNLLKFRIEKEDISLIRKTGSPPPVARVEITGIQQVFLNLLVNAMDAIRNSEKKMIAVESTSKNGRIEISIADSGCGIKPEIARKIFDPFFTTKEVGKGTGLGLAVTKGVVESHGGEIRFESKPGQGSVFKVVLPARTN